MLMGLPLPLQPHRTLLWWGRSDSDRDRDRTHCTPNDSDSDSDSWMVLEISGHRTTTGSWEIGNLIRIFYLSTGPNDRWARVGEGERASMVSAAHAYLLEGVAKREPHVCRDWSHGRVSETAIRVRAPRQWLRKSWISHWAKRANKMGRCSKSAKEK